MMYVLELAQQPACACAHLCRRMQASRHLMSCLTGRGRWCFCPPLQIHFTCAGISLQLCLLQVLRKQITAEQPRHETQQQIDAVNRDIDSTRAEIRRVQLTYEVGTCCWGCATMLQHACRCIVHGCIWSVLAMRSGSSCPTGNAMPMINVLYCCAAAGDCQEVCRGATPGGRPAQLLPQRSRWQRTGAAGAGGTCTHAAGRLRMLRGVRCLDDQAEIRLDMCVCFEHEGSGLATGCALLGRMGSAVCDQHVVQHTLMVVMLAYAP